LLGLIGGGCNKVDAYPYNDLKTLSFPKEVDRPIVVSSTCSPFAQEYPSNQPRAAINLLGFTFVAFHLYQMVFTVADFKISRQWPVSATAG
jgi:hypothetical protein